MKAAIRPMVIGLAVALLAGAGPVLAQSRANHYGGYYHGGYHAGGGHYYRHGPYYWPGRYYWGGPGLFWGGVGIGIGLGGYGNAYSDPWYSGYVVTEPPPVVYEPAPALPSKSAPDPVIYPSRGQSPAQTEADRQACNRWATTQPSAMADASVFQRATLACLEGRGYTVR